MVMKLTDFETDYSGQQFLPDVFATPTVTPQAATTNSTSIIDALTQQILGQKTTDKWTGEGYGGADANAKAMAKLLADAGITDIKQFGKVDKYEPVEVIGYTLNGKTVQNPSKGKYYEETTEGSEGNGYTTNVRYLTPQEIAQVKPTYGVVESAGDAENPAVIRPATNVVERDGKLVGVTGQTWGNKATGQAVNRGTGRWERQGGDDLFSGTGEGDGNTGFRVQMSPDGTPVFYTTKGSSSDLADIMPIIQLGLMATGAGGLLGNALLGAGANQLAASALGGALIGGGSAALTGDSILQGALRGGAGGALGNVLGEALSSGDVSNVTSAGEINAASDIASNMADQGMSIGEINQQLQSVGYQPDAINFALEDALQIFSANNPLQTWGDVAPPIDGEFNWTDPTATPVAVTPTVEFQGPMPNVEVTAPSAPTVAPTLGDVISAIVATPQTPVQPPIENVQVSSEGGSKAGNSGLIVIGSDEYGFPVYGTVDSFAADSPINLSNGRIEAPAYVGFNPDTDLGSSFDSNVISYEGGEGGNEGGGEGGGGEEQVPNIEVTAPANAQPVVDIPAPIIVPPPIDTALPEVTTIAERPSTITNEVEPAPVIVAPPIDTSLPQSTDPLSNLTPSQIANILKGAMGLFGAAGASQIGTNGASPMGVGALPTQGIPLNTQDYFNAIQQNYNTLMPAVPRDVSTPLANWYNSQYGA